MQVIKKENKRLKKPIEMRLLPSKTIMNLDKDNQ